MRNFNLLKTFVWLIIAVFMLALSFASVRAQEEKAAAPGTVTVELKAVGDSGVSGQATLTPADDKTTVSITLTGAPEGVAQPAHIHQGTCADLGAPKYPLQAIENGKSETTIDAKISDLTTGDLAINVHKSKEEIATYVACGEIPKS
jgi:hypothetical protein